MDRGLAITAVVTKVVVAKGRCRCCKRRVRGRHPDQVSDALGAASSQLGPVAQGLIAILAKECGLSHGKVARVLRQLGITVTTGGVAQVLARLAAKADPTYEALKKAVNGSPAVAADETGWRIGGWPGWLWTFAIEAATVYLVDHQRSFEAATKVLEPGYDGVIERDGWAPYRSFKKATAQSWLAYLLRRCSGLIDARVRGYSTVPSILKEILIDALVLRGSRDAGEITAEELGVAVAGLDTRVEALLARRGHTVEKPQAAQALGQGGSRPAHLPCAAKGCRPPTGEPSKPSAQGWSTARCGAAAGRTTAGTLTSGWSRCCEPALSRAVTPWRSSGNSSAHPGPSCHRCRSWFLWLPDAGRGG
jgi:transposase